MPAAPGSSNAGSAGRRTLAGYLTLPRPGDAVKWWIFPVALAVGLISAGGAGGKEIIRAGVVWAVLELLLYQARYQWNDIHGFEADQRHPDAATRGRLPGPLDRGRPHIRASMLVATARLAAAAALVWLLPSLELGPVVLVLFVSVFGLAVVYEALRGRATGRSDGAQPSAPPAIVCLWIVSGGGYAIRGASGLALGAEGTIANPALLVAAILALWGFGVAFVTSRWAIEALSFARVEPTGLVWSASRGQAREHSLALARWLPDFPGTGGPRPGPGRDAVALWPALRGRTDLAAPWNVAMILAAAGAGATGRLLAGSASAGNVLVVALIGALVALTVLSRREGRATTGALLTAVAAIGLGESGVPQPFVVVLPWLLLIAAYLLFSSQSLSTLSRPLRASLASAGRPRAGAARFLPGLRPSSR
jgi:hypothetical protein